MSGAAAQLLQSRVDKFDGADKAIECMRQIAIKYTDGTLARDKLYDRRAELMPTPPTNLKRPAAASPASPEGPPTPIKHPKPTVLASTTSAPPKASAKARVTASAKASAKASMKAFILQLNSSAWAWRGNGRRFE